MQNDETDFPARKNGNNGSRQAKGCLLLIATTILVIFALVIAAAVCIIVVDTVSLRGENYTLEQRVKRYKVACQFLWLDFRDSFSRKKSDSSQEDEPSNVLSPSSRARRR